MNMDLRCSETSEVSHVTSHFVDFLYKNCAGKFDEGYPRSEIFIDTCMNCFRFILLTILVCRFQVEKNDKILDHSHVL